MYSCGKMLHTPVSDVLKSGHHKVGRTKNLFMLPVPFINKIIISKYCYTKEQNGSRNNEL